MVTTLLKSKQTLKKNQNTFLCFKLPQTGRIEILTKQTHTVEFKKTYICVYPVQYVDKFPSHSFMQKKKDVKLKKDVSGFFNT